jgi:xylitol oxidase
MTSPVGATWSGTHRFSAPRLVEATSVEEVQELVAAGGPVRALGTRHSFNDLADGDGTLVTVTSIPPAIELDEAARTVAVGAGTRYGVAAAWIAERGWALHNMGSLPHISIGGAVATGTHGSGDRNGSLSTAVAAIEYVDHRGELVTARRGDPDFDALPVGLGAYGVVVRVTLDVQPSYSIRQDVYGGLPWSTLLGDLDAVTGGGYSVSVFTDWVGDTIDKVFVKRRIEADEAPEEWLGARLRHEQVPILETPDPNTTPQGALVPWHRALPHFRLDSTPSNGDEIQTEYFVDRGVAPEALRAIRGLAERIAPHLLVTELRTVAADALWLSGAYERDAVGIHFTWRNEPEAVAAVLPDVEAALAPFDARPHWGKVNLFDGAAIERVVPRLADARAVFERLDPEGRFSGPALRRLGVRLR